MKIKYLLIYSLLFMTTMFSCEDRTDNTTTDNDYIETINSFDNIENETTIAKAQITKEEIITADESISNALLVFIIVAITILVPAIMVGFYYFVPIGLWYEARLSGIRVSWIDLIVMRWQGVPQTLILKTLIKAQNAGLKLKARELADQYLAEVDIQKVVNTLIRAANANMQIPLKELAAQFLAKVDVEKVINALIVARNADLNIDLKTLASHYLANVDVGKVVRALISAHNSGYEEMTMNDLKEHYLAHGDVTKTVTAFVAARKANLPDFTFKDIAAIDLAGIDVEKAIEAAITPIVVETDGVTGIARDGVQLTMKLKITLRAYLRNIIGGANEETVLARVNESLASEIGQSPNHHLILESPYELADRVEQKNLDIDTSFEIISIDVSDLQVGRDIDAELTSERAKAQAKLAEAEMIKAGEKVQKAMASAFIDGKLHNLNHH